ncbi:MAG: hypothetical protein ABSA12_06685 [Verrucomicrobiia bacterium]
MDIEFYCFKCGQHIVIDAVGVGQAVNCPKCQARLVVPQAQPDSKSESVTQPSAGPSPPPPQPVPTAVPPLMFRSVTHKTKWRVGIAVGLGCLGIIVISLLTVKQIETENTTVSTPLIIHDLEKTPSFTPSAQVEKYAEERRSISNPNYARYISELYDTSTLMEAARASQRYNQAEANTFIGISEEELIHRLGQPCVIRIAETGEGEHYKCLDFGGSTFFNIFEKEGTVWSGDYRGCEFSH